MRNWRPVEIAMLIITITVCTLATISVIGVAIMRSKGLEVSNEQGQRVATVVASLIAIISVWVGSHFMSKRKSNGGDGE